VKVRQALNYCIDRGGLVTPSTARRSLGWLAEAKDADLQSINRLRL